MALTDNQLSQQRLLHVRRYQRTACFVRGPFQKKAVVASFDEDHDSLDAGAILLKACDQRLQLSEMLAACMSDVREQPKVTHFLRELIQQRLFGIACGYVDGNGAARLAIDPAMKMLTGRDSVAGHQAVRVAFSSLSCRRSFCCRVRKPENTSGRFGPASLACASRCCVDIGGPRVRRLGSASLTPAARTRHYPNEHLLGTSPDSMDVVGFHFLSPV